VEKVPRSVEPRPDFFHGLIGLYAQAEGGRVGMADEQRAKFSAAAPAAGYLYQVRYALFDSLRRLADGSQFSVSVETLDDVVFRTDGEAADLLQTKHHFERQGNLTDGSVDLWKSLRVWCEALTNGQMPDGSRLILLTTGTAPEGTASSYLRPGDSRDVTKALTRLNSVARSSKNVSLATAHEAFRNLTESQRCSLLERVSVMDRSPTIVNLDSEIRKAIYHAVDTRFLGAFQTRLEGWWYRRIVRHLATNTMPVLSEELTAELADLREQFRRDNLPIDDEIMRASVDATGYRQRPFVHQLYLLELTEARILFAIKDYFRAYTQRSRWIRDELLVVGELERYEDRLQEEWERHFERMREDLGDAAVDAEKREAARALYAWIEDNHHLRIRSGVAELAIARGTYQMLSDQIRVGWHIEFKERLLRLLEAGAGTA
ncbi:MAG: hypothetical protein OXG11_07675, partial [Chloroflexi bacterium]|nr:hypothetical protein [Chloroflexota bacterium]